MKKPDHHRFDAGRKASTRSRCKRKNVKGKASKTFKIVVGETIALTPPMGWNSWNHYAGRVSAELVLENAKAMVSSGLINQAELPEH